jgi:hypothetical protein
LRDILPLKLTPTTRKILQFIADGGERGRMELQVITVGGSWARRYHDLRNAGYVENAMAPIDQPDRVRVTDTGRAALAEAMNGSRSGQSSNTSGTGASSRLRFIPS